MLAAVFLGIQVMLLKKTAILSEKPSERHLALLAALGLDTSVFLDPGGRCTPIIPLKSGS